MNGQIEAGIINFRIANPDPMGKRLHWVLARFCTLIFILVTSKLTHPNLIRDSIIFNN